MTVPALYKKWMDKFGGTKDVSAGDALLAALLERLGIPEGTSFDEIEKKIVYLEGTRSASDASAKQAWIECERAIATARRAKDDHHAAATLARAFRADGDRAWKAANQAADELRRARRDLRNWESKYARVRKVLDPSDALPENVFTLEELAVATRACVEPARGLQHVLERLRRVYDAVEQHRAARKERDHE